MKADLNAMTAHADAVDALFADNATLLTALIEAQQVMAGYDRTPMREMALQGLAKSVVTLERTQAALSPYLRTLRLYASEVEKAQN